MEKGARAAAFLPFASEALTSPEKLSPQFWYGQVAVGELEVWPTPSLETSPKGVFCLGSILRFENELFESEGILWAKVSKDSWLHFPNRPQTKGDQYVAIRNLQENAEYVEKISSLAPISPNIAPHLKRIEVDLATQTLAAWEDQQPVFRALISSGKKYPTPTGEFHIFLKRLSRYMQGSDFDLPGVPYVMYFDSRGDALHGTYWHKNFGQPMSHGCINLGIKDAEWLFCWTNPYFSSDRTAVWSLKGTEILIHY